MLLINYCILKENPVQPTTSFKGTPQTHRDIEVNIIFENNLQSLLIGFMFRILNNLSSKVIIFSFHQT